MKKLTALIISVIAALALSGCGEDSVSPERVTRSPDNGLNWTIMVYMCGGTQESAYGSATEALKEMFRTDYPENINVLVQTGGSTDWKINGIYSDYLQRFEMQKDGMYMVDQKLESNMGNHGTLTDFLNWGVQNYRADRYAVIFWDGGAGSGGAAHDALHENDALNIEELAFGIGNTGRNFDLIGFDASMMSGLEMAAALSPYADYMVASPDYMPLCWDYEAIFNYLSEHPDISVPDFGRVICDTYYEKCKSNKVEDYAAMTLLDLSRMSSLTQAFDGMAGTMLTATESGLEAYAPIARAVRSAYRYGGQTDMEGYSNAVDISELAQSLNEYIGQTSDILQQITDEAVVYKVPEQGGGESGLSVFYPFITDADIGYRIGVTDAMMADYLHNTPSINYADYLRNICSNLNMPPEEGKSNFYTTPAWQEFSEQRAYAGYLVRVNEQNMLELDYTTSMLPVRGVSFNLYQYNDETGERLMLSTDYNTEVNWDGGIFVGEFAFNRFEINGSPILLTPVSGGGYSAPVILNGELTNLRIRFTPSDRGGSYEIIGEWKGVDHQTGTADRAFRRIKYGDKITPLLKNPDTGEWRESKTITAGLTGAAIKKKRIPDGSYSFEYSIIDIYGERVPISAGPVQITGNQMDWSAAAGL